MSTEPERPADSDPIDPRSSFVYDGEGTTTRWTADADGVHTFQGRNRGQFTQVIELPKVVE